MPLHKTILEGHRVTREGYQAAIPECCLMQTVDEHEDHLLYCWSLLNSLKNHTDMDCSKCELNRNERIPRKLAP